MVAWIWQANASPEALHEGEELYMAHCAACHGEQGKGDGVFADQLSNSTDKTEMSDGAMSAKPANFTDPLSMLSASPVHLQGKILRGGMGTSMPYWGPIFTEDQTWALVAYLWTYQFQMQIHP